MNSPCTVHGPADPGVTGASRDWDGEESSFNGDLDPLPDPHSHHPAPPSTRLGHTYPDPRVPPERCPSPGHVPDTGSLPHPCSPVLPSPRPPGRSVFGTASTSLRTSPNPRPGVEADGSTLPGERVDVPAASSLLRGRETYASSVVNECPPLPCSFLLLSLRTPKPRLVVFSSQRGATSPVGTSSSKVLVRT